MSEFDRFSDDDKVIAGADLQPSDVVIAKDGNVAFYGVWRGAGIACMAVVKADAPPKFINWAWSDLVPCNMPVRTIFETEGAKAREYLVKHFGAKKWF